MLRIEGLSKSFGSRTLLAEVSFQVRGGDRLGLVGRNGEGKTTLLRMLAGLEPCDDGRVVQEGGARIGYLRQEIDPASDTTVIDEARKVLAPLTRLEAQIRDAEAEISQTDGEVPTALAHSYDVLTQEFERRGGFQADARLKATLDGLGLDESRWQRRLSTLSGGWIMRVELAKLLLDRPDVLLLDEPTNHLDLPSIRWFERVLVDYPGAVVVVSHDRTFLDRHTTRILELEQARALEYPGNYSEYERRKLERRREAAARVASLDRQISHARKFVERFGAKATKATQANSRKKQIERLEAERATLLPDSARRGMKLRFPPVPRSGDVALRLEGVAKAYGDLRVYRSLDLELRRGDRIALVGPNGAGKSTLLRLAAGVLAADGGVRELGHNATAAFYAQHQLESLDATRTVIAELESDAPLEEIPRLRGLLGAFLFSGDDVEKKVSVLSGGEKARLALAKLLLGSANFLILDEPTNHLDMQARQVLMDALRDFRGTLLFISHDRTFINALANRVLEVVPGPDGAKATLLQGNFDDYERRLEESATGPSGSTRSRANPARTERVQRATERQERREREKILRQRRAELARTEQEIETAEAAWEANSAQSADPEAARDGARMRELTWERRELEERLEQLNEAWEQLGDEVAGLETELGSS